MTLYNTLQQTTRQRISDGAIAPILEDNIHGPVLVLLWPQLGDFDSLEYAWWLQRDRAKLENRDITVRAVGIGNRASGDRFCQYTGFPPDALFVDPAAKLHQQIDLYGGLAVDVPGLPAGPQAWLNLMLMCAGIGSPGTLAEVFRGYRGDRQAPQLIGDEEVIKAGPLPTLKGRFFQFAGGKDFQRPFELATLRLRNMSEVLSRWKTYVPNAAYLTQRDATFLFDATGQLIYEHRDPGILGFAADMGNPLSFLDNIALSQTVG